MFNLIVLLGIIPWIIGHSVSGMFALQVRKIDVWPLVAAERIQHLE